jgi:uncharacterized protein (TIRG00374 family)
MAAKIKMYIARHWRGIVNILTILAMVVLVWTIRHQIVETLRTIKHVNYWALLLMIPIQILDYDAYARMYRNMLNHLGQPVSYKSMYRVTLELNFVNHAFPSGGISGFSFFGLRLRNYGVKPGTATLIQLLKFILIFISFQVLLIIGLFALAIGNKASDIMILVSAILSSLIVFATLVVAYIVGSRERINSFVTSFTRGINRLIRAVRPGRPEAIDNTRVRRLLDDMHENYIDLRGNFGILRSSFLYSLVANICEIMTVYVVYIAFGKWVNIGAVIIAYAIANFAGFVSVLPGGIGMFEALMTGVLVAGGVPAALSIPVVVMYRVLSMSIQLIPGWILYHRSLRGKSAEA